MKLPAAIAVAGGLALSVSPAAEGPSAEGVKLFESKIRPALVEYCYKCHSADEKIKGGLRLDSREGTRHGGDTGPAVVPGNLGESLLWAAINWTDEDYEMPPKQKLPAEVIADFGRWIEMGAPDPRVAEAAVVDTEIDIEAGRAFWSFQRPVGTPPPAVRDTGWPASDIDRFVLAKLEAEGLRPTADARPDALLRRLYFDLIGLPPSPEEIGRYAQAWKADPEGAYRAKADELLASRHFGERWGRHWLDVARYAESTGKEVNLTLPYAWRYRDYVIDSFNADKPYDRFVEEQVAGDLLKIEDDADWQENLIATGFLAIGTKSVNERDPRQFALDLADEQVDATTQAFLGLTVSCARCHDHKSDPIPTADYYALSGIFQSTRTYFGTVNANGNRRGTRLLELPVPDPGPADRISPSEMQAMRERLAEAEGRLAELQAENRRKRQRGEANNIRNVIRLRASIAQLRARLGGYGEDGVARSVAMGVQDRDRPVRPVVLVRGELDKPAQRVARGFPQVLHHPATPAVPEGSSGRLQLARWIASEENPLTARVMVNRVWATLFGRGIVASPNNFGATGAAPTHPALLDHLAVGFVEGGWSVKALVRDIVNSRSYRMGATFDPSAFSKDPDNALLWRMSPRRLDAEALRDAMLAASGKLDTGRPRGSIISAIGDSAVGRRVGDVQLNRPVEYRSVYLPVARDSLPEALALFDAADPNMVTGVREETNVPGQALYLMNNPFVISQAEAMAERLLAEVEDPRERPSKAFQLCYGRPATRAETEASLAFLRRFEIAADAAREDRDRVRSLAFTTFCQSLFASAEFRYLD